MSRNFNNNNLTDTSILYTLQNLTFTIAALPTNSTVNSTIDNKIQTALNAYSTTSLLYSLIGNQVQSGIYNNNASNLALIKTYTSQQNFSDATVAGLLTLSNNYTLSYTTVPIFNNSKQIGFNNSILNTPVNLTTSVIDNYLNLSSLTLPVGIYMINYTITIACTNINATPSVLWCTYGISTNVTSLNLQTNKHQASVKYGLSFNNSFSHSLFFISTNPQTIYTNLLITSFDNTNIATNITNYSSTVSISYLRIA